MADSIAWKSRPIGSVHFLHNDDPDARTWIRVRLEGVRALKIAEDAQIEIKARNLYRRALYEGVPLTFDTGDAESVDVVRITWPNGLIQNEVRQATNATYTYEEEQRLSGSCPMIWTWNGEKFVFITDVSGRRAAGSQ